MKILGAVLELPAKQHSPFKYLKMRQIGQIGSATYLAGSSQRSPRILIVSIAMGAENSPYVKSIETHVHAFYLCNLTTKKATRRTNFDHYWSEGGTE